MALLVAPALFATLDRASAGRAAAAMFAREAVVSSVFALVVLMLSRREAAERFRPEAWLALGALFCTVFGYYGITPWRAQARAGEPTPLNLSAMQWHGVSMAFFALKIVLVAVLAWRLQRARRT